MDTPSTSNAAADDARKGPSFSHSALLSVLVSPLTATEFSSFLAPAWDANVYSNSILAKADGGSDLSAAISKLNFGIDDISRRLRAEVAQHHAALLAQAAGVTTLDGSLSKVRAGLAEVEGGVERCAFLAFPLSRESRSDKSTGYDARFRYRIPNSRLLSPDWDDCSALPTSLEGHHVSLRSSGDSRRRWENMMQQRLVGKKRGSELSGL